MRRDIGFYVDAPIEKVFDAYLKAATNKPFERDCKKEPYHTISFGVNYSFKYNMNGGSCNIHFMPSGNGTAVNMRFSIAQAMGARYERYAQDLNNAMKAFLPVGIQQRTYDMTDFLKPENKVTVDSFQKQAAPVVPTAPAAPVAPVAPAAAPGAKFCANCGNPLAPGGRFCPQCGVPVADTKKTCPNCQALAEGNAAFCTNCGTRL